MKSFLFAAALVAAGPVAAATNLVVNGDFEAAPAPNGGFIQYFGGNTFPGWTVTGNDVLVIDESYNEGGLVFNAQGGSQNAIDLTGAGNTGPTDGIVQTIATAAGTQYRLTFYVGNASPTGGNAGSYTQPSTLNLSIDGGPLASFTNADNTPFAINYKKFSFVFTAAGATMLNFSNGTVGDNMLGLDTVSVAAIPEPATWGLMIVGFGMVGFASRRRRIAVVTA
jgi:hypothetical protein